MSSGPTATTGSNQPAAPVCSATAGSTATQVANQNTNGAPPAAAGGPQPPPSSSSTTAGVNPPTSATNSLPQPGGAQRARGRNRRSARRHQPPSCLIHGCVFPCNRCNSTRHHPYQRGQRGPAPPVQMDQGSATRLTGEILSILEASSVYIDFHRLRDEIMRSYRPNF